jgi:hypothetical protein
MSGIPSQIAEPFPSDFDQIVQGEVKRVQSLAGLADTKGGHEPFENELIRERVKEKLVSRIECGLVPSHWPGIHPVSRCVFRNPGHQGAGAVFCR